MRQVRRVGLDNAFPADVRSRARQSVELFRVCFQLAWKSYLPLLLPGTHSGHPLIGIQQLDLLNRTALNLPQLLLLLFGFLPLFPSLDFIEV